MKPFSHCFAVASLVPALTAIAAGDAPPPGAPTSVAETHPAPGGDEFAAERNPFRAELNLWFWLMGLDGDVGVRDLTVPVSESFVDIAQASDSIVALSGRLELGYGKLGGYIDGFYADLTAEDQTGPQGLSDVDVSLQQTIVDFGLMYRVLDWDRTGHAGENPRNMTLDLYGGGRYSGLEIDLRPANAATRSDGKEWLDPVVGAKLVAPLAEHWHLAVNGDVGGFGVASDLTWSATAVIGYDFYLFDCPASVMLGYRAISWDYSERSGNNEFTWDVVAHGGILGLSLEF